MKSGDFFGFGFVIFVILTVFSVIYVNSGNISDYIDALLRGEFLIETAGSLSAVFAILFVLTNKDLNLALQYYIRDLAINLSKKTTLLQEGVDTQVEPKLSVEDVRKIISEEVKGSTGKSIDVTPDERDALLLRLENRLESQIGKDFNVALRKKYVQESMEMLYLRSLNRLKEQVNVLGSRANTSLLIGILFSVSGLLALYITFFSQIDFTDRLNASVAQNFGYLDLMREYLPRLSLVLLIEIVGFFFLRLYSKALGELRYAQNETTNVELKLIALMSSIASGHQDSTVEVIKSFAQTERNNIIERTQTTIEIERERSSREGEAGTINAISSLLHGTEKGWFWKKRE